MTLSFENYVSPNEVLADVLVTVNDEEMKMLRPGWYNRQIHEGLKKLNYQAPYVELFTDLDMPTNLILDVPAGAFGINDIFLFTGEDCVLESSVRAFHKNNFHQTGKGNGYTARNKPGMEDPFIFGMSSGDSMYFYNVNMGRIVFSDACASFTGVRIVYNGFPKAVNTVNFIPDYCKEALSAYVVERVYYALQGRDLAYRTLWQSARLDLYQSPSPGQPSKWDFAIRMLKKLDKKHRDDLGEYLSKMQY